MDIVERLRDWCEDPHDVSMGELAEYSHEAANEIERLRSIIKKADAILAEKYDHWSERIESARNALFEGLEETR
jgi:hypothetical protein